MTTETADALVESVMAAADEYHGRSYRGVTECCEDERSRLRLTIELALAKARREEGALASTMGHKNRYYDEKIAALEARLAEGQR